MAMLVLTNDLPSPGIDELTNKLFKPEVFKYCKLDRSPLNCSAIKLRLPSFMIKGLSLSTWIISAKILA